MLKKLGISLIQDALVSGGVQTFNSFIFDTSDFSQEFDIKDFADLMEAKELLDLVEWEKLKSKGRQKQIGYPDELENFEFQAKVAEAMADERARKAFENEMHNKINIAESFKLLQEVMQSYTPRLQHQAEIG